MLYGRVRVYRPSEFHPGHQHHRSREEGEFSISEIHMFLLLVDGSFPALTAGKPVSVSWNRCRFLQLANAYSHTLFRLSNEWKSLPHIFDSASKPVESRVIRTSTHQPDG